ncbi:hypothetical protein GBF38_010720 [Nibea albiflora]|uniref:Uncharacterized protein n=1 Tax=Nibea albiflora TaxID=240163 RepID=A0ACB7ERQ8_NIBAL|nr:hypothetical protein GBF38_010720 [Nibea albiflora]
MKKENWHPTNTSRLCSAHFEEDQFCVDERVCTVDQSTSPPSKYQNTEQCAK